MQFLPVKIKSILNKKPVHFIDQQIKKSQILRLGTYIQNIVKLTTQTTPK